MRLFHRRRLGIAFWGAIALAVCTLLGAASRRFAAILRVRFSDVYQVDCTLVDASSGALLLDVGSGNEHSGAVVAYLDDFLRRRTDLDRTPSRAVVDQSKVKRVIDNGKREGRGGTNQTWLAGEIAAHRPNALRE